MGFFRSIEDKQGVDEPGYDERLEAREAEREERLTAELAEADRREFLRTPAGSARLAFDREDHVFQCAFDVLNQQAIIVSLIGSTTTRHTADPNTILNSVCAEGWELVNGSFVFVEQGQQSREKLLSSGQNVATKGAVLGYYLFRRCEQNKSLSGDTLASPMPPSADGSSSSG